MIDPYTKYTSSYALVNNFLVENWEMYDNGWVKPWTYFRDMKILLLMHYVMFHSQLIELVSNCPSKEILKKQEKIWRLQTIVDRYYSHSCKTIKLSAEKGEFIYSITVIIDHLVLPTIGRTETQQSMVNGG